MCVCVNVCCCLQARQPPSASVYGRGSSARQPRADQTNIEASGCAALWAHQRPQGRSKAAFTPPQPKSVHVVFKDGCARNPPARAQHNMRRRTRPSFCAVARIFRGSAETSSPGKPLLKTKNTKNTHAPFCRARRRAGRALKIRQASQLRCGTHGAQKISLIGRRMHLRERSLHTPQGPTSSCLHTRLFVEHEDALVGP